MNQDGSAAGQMGGDPSVRQAGATGAVVQDGSNTAPAGEFDVCLLYTSPSPRDASKSRMPSSA